MPSPAAMTGPPNGAPTRPTSASPAVEDEGSVEEAREAWQAMRSQVRAPAE